MGRMLSRDFDGDGRPDLAVVVDGGFAIMMGTVDGTFAFRSSVSLPAAAWSIVAGDFNGDGHDDLILGNWSDYDDFETFVPGNGDGSFGSPQQEKPPFSPLVGSHTLVAGEFGPGGMPEIVTGSSLVISHASYWEYSLEPLTSPSARAYSVLISGDFNGDGRLDLAVVRSGSDSLWVALNDGAGTLVASSSLASARDDTPLVGDFDEDGIADVLEIDANGDILDRQGRAADPGTFAPPITVNPAIPARDLAYAMTDRGAVLAAINDGRDSVSLYRWIASGFAWIGSLPCRPRSPRPT
jgi:FG-GAP-like repeat